MDETLRLVVALSEAERRSESAAALASHLGGTALYAFVPHPDRTAGWITAPGFHPTVPSRRGWRELLARCAGGPPGVYEARVAWPTADETAPAVAYAWPHLTLVLVDPTAPPREGYERVAPVAPLLGALLRAEMDVAAARGDLEVASEVTARAAALARALDAARGEAERATRVKDEFLAMLGHELRNPLAPIVTAVQLLRRGRAQARALDVIERQVGHVTRLVDDLLDVSRITNGKVELRRERVEVAEVLSRAVEIARPLLEQRRVELEVRAPPGGLAVDGDPARLAQVVSNLLTNAAKYSDPGTHVGLTAERAGERARVTVEDQGVGLDPTFLARVFDPFVQVPRSLDRSAGGLGLGLAIVRSLVELHGGTVGAFSAGRGLGSTFVVESPLCGEGTPTSPPALSPDAASPAVGAAPRRVLVVDDNEDAAELLGEILAARGCDVRVAHDGRAALDLVVAFEPELALLDIGLPGMNGYELAGLLRKLLPSLRLVAVTGYGQPGDRERTRRHGFDAHLVKPVNLEDIGRELDRLP